MMQINPNSRSTHSLSGDAGPTTGLDMSAHGLSRKTWVPTENVDDIQAILGQHFQDFDFTNLKAAVTPEQYDALLNLNKLGALDTPTLHDILDQNHALQHQVPAATDHQEEVGSDASSASRDAPRSDRSREDEQDRAERGVSARDAGVPAPADESERGNRFFGSLSAAGRAIGNALPRATPVVMDVVCLGLSVPIAGLAIAQAIEESSKPNHDSTLLFMKATLPTVVAMNSLRNIIKYGTDGRRV